MKVKWSQNFLTDRSVAREIISALKIGAEDTVVEIGPGKGVLTEGLLPHVKNLVAVEIDPKLCHFLEGRFGAHNNFNLIQGDFLRLDIFSEKIRISKPWKIVANLPYAVTSPILQKILDWEGWDLAVVMTQKEVGKRILSGSGTKEYGILTVSVQCKCRTEAIRSVSRFCFRPVPQVESMVLRLSPLERRLVSKREEKHFFEVVRGAFNYRRKTLINALSLSLKMPSETLKEKIEGCGLSPATRAENLTILDFKKLSESVFC